MTEPKEPTIEDHIKRAKELTIPQVSVREEAFTELVKAVEGIAAHLTAPSPLETVREVLNTPLEEESTDEEE